uniref:DM2 domain-containing protein n=1 Tax=viral metagenome TaxID=1070528 RepID=A0A6C0AS44_9ZZZZ
MKSENNELHDEEVFSQFDNLINGLQTVKLQINILQHSVKQIEKTIKKKMKGLKKEVTKNKQKGNRKPSGFAKPGKITKELCFFLNKEEGTEIARTEVTRALIAYIKENKLHNNDNGQIIHPDNKLKTLLGLDDNQNLTYFTIQKYMNKHFVKNSGV